MQRLRLRHPAHEFLVTTTTGTGYDVARQKLADAVWQIGVRVELTELAQETAGLIEELERRQSRGCE